MNGGEGKDGEASRTGDHAQEYGARRGKFAAARHGYNAANRREEKHLIMVRSRVTGLPLASILTPATTGVAQPELPCILQGQGQSVIEIPALSPWGLAARALTFLVAGSALLSRRA